MPAWGGRATTDLIACSRWNELPAHHALVLLRRDHTDLGCGHAEVRVQRCLLLLTRATQDAVRLGEHGPRMCQSVGYVDGYTSLGFRVLTTWLRTDRRATRASRP